MLNIQNEQNLMSFHEKEDTYLSEKNETIILARSLFSNSIQLRWG